MKTLYTARASAIGGRNGNVETSDGHLFFKLAPPITENSAPLSPDSGTNPEQLFACSYASCFGNAIQMIAENQGLKISPVTVDAEISLNYENGSYTLGAVLDVSLPDVDNETAENLVSAAHQMCPYSKATRGNITVVLKANHEVLKSRAA